MVALFVSIVNVTVWRALAPLPPSPAGTELPAASVLIVPLAEELSRKLRFVTNPALACIGTVSGKIKQTIKSIAAEAAEARLTKSLSRNTFCLFPFWFLLNAAVYLLTINRSHKHINKYQ